MPKLIVAIVLDIDVCHEVIRVWEKAGVSGATILDFDRHAPPVGAHPA